MAEMRSASQQGAVPNPDPTVRTVEQLQRDIQALRDLLEAKNDGVREVFETRLNGMDKAIQLLQEATNRIPQHIKDEVDQLRELHEEKFRSTDAQSLIQFAGIATQFAERDKRTEQLSLADKTAIAAALQAQKEDASAKNESNATATAKMEANFAKLIEQGQTLLMEVRRNTEAQINDLKSRLDKGEGTSRGSDKMADRTSSVVGLVIAGSVAFVVIMTAVVGVVAFTVARPAPVVTYMPTPPANAAR